jgi:acetylornithine deacetylase/succinyl-diaminopimelate desuccinylase-like protein
MVSNSRKVASQINDAEIERLLFDLVRIPSVNPRYSAGEPDETRIIEYLAGKLAEFGFKVEKQKVEGKRSNVIARIGDSGLGVLALNGHLDSVTGANMRKPFTPRICGNRLYGRGSSDMKGGIAAMIEATKAILLSGMELYGEVMLSLVVDEEYMGMGTNKFLEKNRPDWVIVGEPTQNRIGLAQAGYIELDLESRGEIKHGSSPRIGENPSAYINTIRILNRILELPSIKEKRHHLDIEIYNTVNICPRKQRTFTSYEWMTVDFCETGILIGVAPRKSMAESNRAIKDMVELLGGLIDDSNKAGQRNKIRHSNMNGFIQPRNDFARRFERATDEIQGAHQHTYFSSFCDGTFFYNKGIPTLLYGPGRMDLGHSDNEYVDLNEVKQAARTYGEAIVRILGTEREPRQI